MKIVLANDHAAVALKEQLKKWMIGQGHKVTDLGVQEGEKSDYPDKGKEAAQTFLKNNYDFGVICCGTGTGISISANKIKGIRCALPPNKFVAEMAREHNNCQFIAFGGRIDYPDNPVEILKVFLETPFTDTDRHARRVEKINALDEE